LDPVVWLPVGIPPVDKVTPGARTTAAGTERFAGHL